MAHDRSGWRSTGRRIGKTLGRKPSARRRNNLVRRVELGVEQLEPRWVLTAGALDTTFDPVDFDGVLIGNLGVATANVRFTTVTTQADGKILAAGSFDALSNNQQDFVVARFNVDGSLDTTFGVDGSDADSLPDGYITFDFSLPAGQSIAQDITLDSLGRIIVVGNGPSAANFNSWAIARLTTSGQLDATFNGTGKVVTAWSGSSANVGAEAHGVAIDSSDRIIVVGDVRNSSSSTEFDWGIVRYNTNGSIDTSFGSSGTGRVTVNFFNSRDVANDVKIQADGKIVVAGYARNGTQSDNFAIARFDTNGLLDASFGTGGLVDTNIDPTAFVSQDQASSLQIEADGRIVLTGFSNVRPGSVSTFTTTEFTVARYTAAGALDTTFNPTPSASFPSVPGTRRIDFGGNKDSAEGVGIQVDGQYVIAGSVSNPAVNDDNDKFGLVRLVNNSLLVPDGTPDSTFGSGGQVTTRITDYVAGTISLAILTDMTLQPDGKIVTTGYLRGSDNRERFVIARYESGLATQTIAGDANVDEGATYTLNLSSGDPTTSQWTINWGDSTEVVSGNPTSVTHVYADGNANYIVTATVTTATGTSPITNSVAVAVNNVAPTLAISGATDVNEGSVYTLNLSSSDPGTDTISQWTINWGDSIEVVAGNPASITHTYADGDTSYTISATATDEDGNYAAGNTVGVTVYNVAPTLTISGAATVNEGSVYVLNLSSTDPGVDTISSWTINWGDGIQVVAGNPSSVTHTYADGSASYTISATATDEDGTYAAGNTVNITVNNVAPTLAISGAASVNEGSTYTLNLSSSDPGADTITQWTINWGNGTQIVSGNPSSVTHVYPNGPASYTITATATDEDGTFAAANTVTVAVNNVAPTIHFLTITPAVDANQPATLTGTYSDPGTSDTHQVDIDWNGDGTFDQTVTVSGGSFSVDHAYATAGTLNVKARVRDNNGGTSAVATAQVTVLGVGATLVGGTLHLVGTDQSDIVTIDKSGNQLKVVASFANNFIPISFNLASVTQIYVRVYGGSDIVAVKNTVTIPAIIDGGAGNDVLTAGGGNTYLLGGAGNDVLVGGPGNNVLVGGAGSDVITGGSGRDLIIGGDGTDVLSGGTGDDILIGGWTIHDTNVAALNAVMNIWTSSASFNSRVATLTALGGLLEANVAVFDDDDHDVLSGDSGRDLVFANTNLWSGDFDVVALQLIDDLLVSLA